MEKDMRHIHADAIPQSLSGLWLSVAVAAAALCLRPALLAGPENAPAGPGCGPCGASGARAERLIVEALTGLSVEVPDSSNWGGPAGRHAPAAGFPSPCCRLFR